MLFTIFYFVQDVKCQCCSAGSPIGASAYGGIVNKNSLRLIAYVRYSESDDYYTGTTKDLNYGLLSYTDYLFQGLTAAYGITKKLNLETELGYFYYKTQYFKSEPTEPQIILKGYGLTNGIISAKYAVYKSISKALELTLGAGLKFPFSTEPQYVDDVLIPEDIQPSTSAFGWMGQMILQKEFTSERISVFLYNRYEQNSVNSNGYEYSNRLRASIIASKKFKKNAGIIVQTRYEYIGQDISNDAILANTGANLIILSPQLLYSINKKWNLITGVDLPVYKNYKGTQISTNYAVSLSLSHDFSLNKKNQQ